MINLLQCRQCHLVASSCTILLKLKCALGNLTILEVVSLDNSMPDCMPQGQHLKLTILHAPKLLQFVHNELL